MAKVTVEEAWRNIRRMGKILIGSDKPGEPVVMVVPKKVEDKVGFGFVGGPACPASIRRARNGGAYE